MEWLTNKTTSRIASRESDSRSVEYIIKRMPTGIWRVVVRVVIEADRWISSTSRCYSIKVWIEITIVSWNRKDSKKI